MRMAGRCAAAPARTRVMVTSAVTLAIREHLGEYYGVGTGEGRSALAEFAEFLDLADFMAGRWRVEVRLVSETGPQQLLVPTVPIMVGAISDIYLVASVDRQISQSRLLSFALQSDLARAELSANGLFASLGRADLRSPAGLAELLHQEPPGGAVDGDQSASWRLEAEAMFDQLGKLWNQFGRNLGPSLTADEHRRLAGKLRDELWRIHAARRPAPAIMPLIDRLFRLFGLADPVPALDDQLITFQNSVVDETLVRRPDLKEAFLTDKLSVGERIAFYRHLIADQDTFAELHQRRRLFDLLSHGQHQSPPGRSPRRSRFDDHDHDHDHGDADQEPGLEVSEDLPGEMDQSGEQEAAPIDLELFAERYHQILLSLRAWFPGLQIEPGGDVFDGSRVIGSYFAEMDINGIRIRLVDAASPATQRMRETLAVEGDVLMIDPDRRSQSVELLKLALVS